MSTGPPPHWLAGHSGTSGRSSCAWALACLRHEPTCAHVAADPCCRRRSCPGTGIRGLLTPTSFTSCMAGSNTPHLPSTRAHAVTYKRTQHRNHDRQHLLSLPPAPALLLISACDAGLRYQSQFHTLQLSSCFFCWSCSSSHRPNACPTTCQRTYILFTFQTATNGAVASALEDWQIPALGIACCQLPVVHHIVSLNMRHSCSVQSEDRGLHVNNADPIMTKHSILYRYESFRKDEGPVIDTQDALRCTVKLIAREH